MKHTIHKENRHFVPIAIGIVEASHSLIIPLTHFQIFKLVNYRILFLILFPLWGLGGIAQTKSIANPPVISGEISGPQSVCLHIPYTYALNENDPDFIYVWKAEGGKVIGNNTGKEVTIVFTSPNGKVSAVKQLFVNGDFLRSEPKILSVQQMVLAPKIINTSGSDVFYTSSVNTFSLDLGDVVPDHIQWRIVGNGAVKNFGNIIDGIYETDVTISFNEVYRSFNGAVVAEVTKCGVTAVAAFEIKLQGKPLPNIKHKECEYEGAPDPRFSLQKTVFYHDEPLTLTVPDYNPDYLYRWSFNGTHYFADGPETKVQFPAEQAGMYNIRLTIITPEGCAFMTPIEDSVVVTIYKAEFAGSIVPTPAHFCEENLLPLSFTPMNPFNQSSNQVIWMQNNKEVGRGVTYQPIQNGSYWVILVDENGGKDYSMVQNPTTYLIQKPPFASISSPSSITQGEKLVLYGIVTDENVKYKWRGVSLPEGFGDWSSEKANTILKIKDLNPGTYDFTFHTRFAADDQCANSHTVTIEVINE